MATRQEISGSSFSDGTPLSQIGERRMLARLIADLPRDGLVVGAGDDAAAFALPRGEIAVASTDTLVEDVHFRAIWSTPEDLGHRLVMAAASDLAAMAATPTAVLMAVSAPGALRFGEFRRLVSSAAAAAGDCGMRLAGGDTTRSEALVLTATVIGAAPADRLTRRDAARVGDVVYVTGCLGDAAAGLLVLEAWRQAETARSSGDRESHLATAAGAPPGCPPVLVAAVERFLRPAARVREALLLRDAGVRAMIDISDGVASEIHHLVAASGVGARLSAAALPVGPGAREWTEAHGGSMLDLAIQSGEEYELLFTAGAGAAARVDALIAGGLDATRIGMVVEPAAGVTILVEGEARALAAGGYEHFG